MGGFGIASPEDLLFVKDLVLIEQQCTEVTVEFADRAVADFFDDQIDLNRRPEQFARIWIHTHPGDSPRPSSVDVETFERVFGQCDWAVMFIIAQSGKTYAELYWRHGGPASLRMQVDVDYAQPFLSSDHETWAEEYHTCVTDRSALISSAEIEWDDWLIENWESPEMFADPAQDFDPQETEIDEFQHQSHQEYI